MEQRLDFYKASPDALKALIALEVAVGKLGLEPALLDLVKLRASQINGCAFCVDLHASDLRKKGETERRLYAVPVWRETPFFTPRERAALAWTEAITQVATQPRARCRLRSAERRVQRTRAGRPDARDRRRSTAGTGCRSAFARP